MVAVAHADPYAFSLRRVALIAFLSVVLGIAVQGMVLALALWERGAGEIGPLIGAAAGVSWSLLICTGVGIGTLLTQGRPHLTGLLSATLAPVSLAVAKASGKAMSGWLSATQGEALLTMGSLGTLRAIEYGLLGWLLGRLAAAGQDRPWPYVAAGMMAGGTFGSVITGLTIRAGIAKGDPLTDGQIAATVVNEVMFPMGCALVIYLGLEVGRSLKLLEAKAGTPFIA